MEKEDYFESLFMDISSVLEDLGQSGFHTVHDSTLRELKEKGEMASQYGMKHLSGLLLSLQEELSGNRHRFLPPDSFPDSSHNIDGKTISKDGEHIPADGEYFHGTGSQTDSHGENADSRCTKYYTELIRYITLAREKTAYDKGKNYYIYKKEDQQSL